MSKHTIAANWRRFAAIAYDLLPLCAALMLASALWLSIIFLIDPQYVQNNHHIGYDVAQSNIYRLYLLSVIFLYFAISWRYGGQTIGMRAWKIQLTADSSKSITWSCAFLRFSAALFSFLLVGIGFLWCLIDKKHRTFHDIVARTTLENTIKQKKMH